MLDTDLMAIRSLDELFRPEDPELTIAHHLADLSGGVCGIPPSQRGLSAVFGIRPSREHFDQLVSYMHRTYSTYVWAHHCEQLGIACFFYDERRSYRALPSTFVFHIPFDFSCQRSDHQCLKFGNYSRQQACLLRPQSRGRGPHDGSGRGEGGGDGLRCFLKGKADPCQRQTASDYAAVGRGAPPAWRADDPRCLVSREECAEIADQASSHCEWSAVHRHAHAVHFKGPKKPWVMLRPGDTKHPCAPATAGGHMVTIMVTDASIGAAPARRPSRGVRGAHNVSAVSPRDDLSWSSEREACVSRNSGREVSWRDGGGVPKRCCNGNYLLVSYWFWLAKVNGDYEDSFHNLSAIGQDLLHSDAAHAAAHAAASL